jgi:molybdopterin molybdotransferase
MISVEEALERILAEIQPLTTTHVSLPESLGLVLAEDVIAQEDMPPFANSAMDGFALLSQDSRQQAGQPARLRVTGGVAAGYVADHAVEDGTAMRIMTGAPVPPGADSVIQVELTRSEGIIFVPQEKICIADKKCWSAVPKSVPGKSACWRL